MGGGGTHLVNPVSGRPRSLAFTMNWMSASLGVAPAAGRTSAVASRMAGADGRQTGDFIVKPDASGVARRWRSQKSLFIDPAVAP